MKKPQVTNIAGHVVHVQCFPTRLGFEVERRLARALAPALHKLGGAVSSVQDLARLDVGVLADGFQTLLENMPESEFEWLQARLLELIMIDNKSATEVVDGVFQGELLAYNKLLWFAIKANFADFGAGLRAAAARLGDVGKNGASSSSSADTETRSPAPVS